MNGLRELVNYKETKKIISGCKFVKLSTVQLGNFFTSKIKFRYKMD